MRGLLLWGCCHRGPRIGPSPTGGDRAGRDGLGHGRRPGGRSRGGWLPVAGPASGPAAAAGPKGEVARAGAGDVRMPSGLPASGTACRRGRATSGGERARAGSGRRAAAPARSQVRAATARDLPRRTAWVLHLSTSVVKRRGDTRTGPRKGALRPHASRHGSTRPSGRSVRAVTHEAFAQRNGWRDEFQEDRTVTPQGERTRDGPARRLGGAGLRGGLRTTRGPIEKASWFPAPTPKEIPISRKSSPEEG